VLGWNFLKQVVAEIRCAGHEIIIPARNRHNGWLEEKLSVAVVQQVNELDDTKAFLEAELADFSTMTGTSNMPEHQIKMRSSSVDIRNLLITISKKKTETKIVFCSVKVKINWKTLPLTMKYVENRWMLGFSAFTRQVMSTASLSVNSFK